MANMVATIIVAIIGLVGVIIQTKSHDKIKSQEELLNEVEKKIDTLRSDSKKEDERLNNRLTNIDMENCKRFLVASMSKMMSADYIPNSEEKRILYETKDRYNEYGGDSYVDSMFDNLKSKKIL